ncbi:hypothetical protein [Budvicia aquatica]|uniref:Invasin n=1 Tax=Budvicia aquatica TaxID=82979 RepID=A0A2C6DS52_9GAMM|nr:hypothetical protein [Budvicia aquatica]PHI31533.1 hypothetical protein CRN84_20425 [Budvicia aquatica]VFS51990.1 Invasin [Budvicia aquatica]
MLARKAMNTQFNVKREQQMTTTRQRNTPVSRPAVSALFVMVMASFSAGVQADVQPPPQARLTITDEPLAVQTSSAIAPVVVQAPPVATPVMPVTSSAVSGEVVPTPPVSMMVPVEPILASSTPGDIATVLVSGKIFPVNGYFPQTGFVGATFQVLMNGRDPEDNTQYQWHSNQNWVGVDTAGTVTFTGTPTPQTRSVTVTATPITGGTPQTLTLTINRWFINAKAEKMTAPAAIAWCQSQGDGFAVPDAVMMTATSVGSPSLRDANGKLWNEWGTMALYRSGWQLDNYWGAKVQANTREMVGLVGGSFYWVPESSKYLVTCARAL